MIRVEDATACIVTNHVMVQRSDRIMGVVLWDRYAAGCVVKMETFPGEEQSKAA